MNVIYPKPLWREDGLSGLAISDRGPVGVTFDNSPPDASRGVLVGFINPEKAPKDNSDRRKAILEGFVALFGKAAKIRRLTSRRTGQRGVDGWMRFSAPVRCADRVRGRAPHTSWPYSLGRNGNVRSLVRLYGRGGSVGSARSPPRCGRYCKTRPQPYSGGASICPTCWIASSRFSDGASNSRPSRWTLHPRR